MKYTIKNTGAFIIGLNLAEHHTLQMGDVIEVELDSITAKEIKESFESKGIEITESNNNSFFIEKIPAIEIKEVEVKQNINKGRK
jgi:sugar phosphate isomerase/epimerase